MSVLSRMYGRISGSPFSSLADVLGEVPTEVQPAGLAVPFGDSDARHELTVFVHPSCNKCNAALTQARALMQAGLVRVAVGLAPKDPEVSDRRMCTAIVAAGIGAAPIEVAYATAKEHLKEMMDDDPVGTLVSNLPADRKSIELNLERARNMVRLSERFVDEHAEGTPAVFLDARLYRGELSHLGFLLQRHPDLLEATLSIPVSRDTEAVTR